MGNCSGGEQASGPPKQGATKVTKASTAQKAPQKPSPSSTKVRGLRELSESEPCHHDPSVSDAIKSPSQQPVHSFLTPPTPRAPINVKWSAQQHAANQLIGLLKYVKSSTKNRSSKFTRWIPFQEKYEEYLFTDVLRKLEIKEEQDMMSDDDNESIGPCSTLGDLSVDLNELEQPPEEWLEDLITSLKKEKKLRQLPSENDFLYLMKTVQDLFTEVEPVVHIAVPENGRLVIVGDLHGQLDDLLWILAESKPSATTHYLFNGDFVDRGPDQCEVLVLLYAMKVAYPDAVWLNRGNHEEHRVNKAAGKDGFMQVCINSYSDRAYKAAQKSFKALPLCHVINNKVCVMHGGLPGDSKITLKEIRAVDRFRECPVSKNRGKIPPATREDRIFQAMLWSDPRDMEVRSKESSRGAGVWFNEEVTKEFLKVNDLQKIIRSHEVVSSGHRGIHGDSCMTVFSASRYCGKDDNRGSYLVLFENLDISPHDYAVKNGEIAGLRGKIADGISESETEDGEEGDSVDADEVRRMAVRRLGELFFAKRSQLLSQFQLVDTNFTGTVTKKQWINIVRSIVHEDLPWHSLARHLVRVEESGTISYIRFLERFQNKLANSWMRSWAETWLQYGKSHLTKGAIEMKKMLQQISTYRSQTKLSYHEVCAALRTSIPGLSMTEIYYLLCHMDENNDGYIDADEWAAQLEGDSKGALPGILDIWDLQRTSKIKYDAIFKSLEALNSKGVSKSAFVTTCMEKCGANAADKKGWELTANSLAGPNGKVSPSAVLEAVANLENDRHRYVFFEVFISACE
eukprot:TRINITY_DN7526_c0_g1_i2.p1 TRINITY_DN7526_c0_g1~~TRINITY_DN7526_c0_g1_i2.p1  ORF type:complete len:798 (+),score=151.55 TRINITY_DN7526_c0_g1_i2:77-2470(+)